MPSQNVIDGAWMDTEAGGEGLVMQGGAGNVEFSDQGSLFGSQFRPSTTMKVLRVAHWFKVVWVHARGLPTQMVKVINNCSVSSDVGLSVREIAALHASSVPETSVAICISRPLPDPARGFMPAIFDFPQMGTPLNNGLDAARVALHEPERLTPHPSEVRVVPRDDQRVLAAPAFAEFRRLLSHVGLLVRLVVGRAASTALPHSTGWCG